MSALKELQHKSGLLSASVTEHYRFAWIRDNVYSAMGFEAVGDFRTVNQIYAALFNIFIRYENKIDSAIAQKPSQAFEYIHARYNPDTLDEIWDCWGNKQNDAVGAFLFKVGDLYSKNRNVMRDSDDKRLVQKLVHYLGSVEYWKNPDQGMWEVGEELRASSIGACVAGLMSAAKIDGICVQRDLVNQGVNALNSLLPNEYSGRDVDMALLSLIWPYDIAGNHEQAILEAVKSELEKEHGMIRYKGDNYAEPNHEIDVSIGSPEWPLGDLWMSKIYSVRGNNSKSRKYREKAERHRVEGRFCESHYPVLQEDGSIGYVPNKNKPLAWTESMYLVSSRN